MGSYFFGKIQGAINTLGGLTDEGLVPRIFYTRGGKSIQQLSLFESRETEYEAGEVQPIELD